MTKTVKIFVGIVALFLVVLGSLKFISKSQYSCLHFPQAQKKACVKTIIDRFLKKNEINPALEFLSKYSLVDKQFSGTDCHAFAHQIGEKASQIYLAGKEINVNELGSICGYGFYHSFMKGFVLRGEFEKADNYCELLKTKSDKNGSCYHGLGHGLAYFIEEDLNIKDFKEFTKEGLSLCEKTLNNDKDKVKECLTGVFGGLDDIVSDQKLLVDFSGYDFYALCNDLKKNYQSTCYESITILIFDDSKESVPTIVDLIESPKVLDKESAIRGLAAVLTWGGEENYSKGALMCKGFETGLKRACIENMASNVLATANSSARFNVAESFCVDNNFSSEERKICLETLKRELSNYYFDDELKFYLDLIDQLSKT